MEDSASGVSGTAGPVSLVVLSEEKRALRGSLLKQMMKVRSKVEAVLQGVDALGALVEHETLPMVGDQVVDVLPSHEDCVDLSCRKRTWLSSFVATDIAPAPRKKTRNAKFKVIYRKK